MSERHPKMSDNLSPGLGTTIAVSAALPATDNVAGYGALTFTTIGEVTDIPSFGPEHDVVTHVPLATGLTAKYHGSKNTGSLTVPMALDRTDDGQTALKDALSSKDRIAFEITYADGSIDYFSGKVFSFTRGASIGEVVTAEVMIEIETDIIEDDAA